MHKIIKTIFFLFMFFSNKTWGKSDKLDIMFEDHIIQEVVSNTNSIDIAINKLIKMPVLQRKRIATLISMASLEYNLNPKLFLAIIYIESRFDQKATNKTGDFSLAQINYNVWSKGFPKLKLGHLNFTKLKEDESYAIYRMAQILNYLKTNFEKKDPYWYALYHSATPKYKNRYIQLLKKPLKILKNENINQISLMNVEMDKIWQKVL